MSIRDVLTGYYKTFGLRGVFAISSYRIVGRPKEIRAQPPGIRNPINLRLRTSDVLVYSEILLHEEYAIDLPYSPKTIVDAGANIGMTSIYFTHKYPEAKIIAIEAEASNYSVLARNVRPYPAITPVHAALWNRDGQISVCEPDPGTGVFGKWGYVTGEGPGPKVRAITMDTLMREAGIQTIDVAKIDIEGAEREVFEDTGWVAETRCLMIELHDSIRPGCSEAVEPAMQGFARSQLGQTTFYVRDSRVAHTVDS